MKASTRQYLRLVKLQCKIISELRALRSQIQYHDIRKKIQKLEARYSKHQQKVSELSNLISQIEFEQYLESELCCTWEDFTDTNTNWQ